MELVDLLPIIIILIILLMVLIVIVVGVMLVRKRSQASLDADNDLIRRIEHLEEKMNNK